jgi:hypothetical protein
MMKSYLTILFLALLTGLITPCFAVEVQLESFDDLTVSGWYDTRGSGLMIQAPPDEVNEGTGSMRIRFEDRPPEINLAHQCSKKYRKFLTKQPNFPILTSEGVCSEKV